MHNLFLWRIPISNLGRNFLHHVWVFLSSSGIAYFSAVPFLYWKNMSVARSLISICFLFLVWIFIISFWKLFCFYLFFFSFLSFLLYLYFLLFSVFIWITIIKFGTILWLVDIQRNYCFLNLTLQQQTHISGISTTLNSILATELWIPIQYMWAHVQDLKKSSWPSWFGT